MHRTLPDGTSLHTLPNGLRVVISSRGETGSAVVAVVVGSGSKYETVETNGLAHFLEHMLFKGTKHHPGPGGIDRAVASMGGDINAATGVETTVFTLQVPGDQIREAISLMGEIIGEPLISKDDVEHEKTVVMEEVGDKTDDSKDVVETAFAGLLFPSHGLGLPITGTLDDLRRFSESDLRKLYVDAYTPENMVVSIVSSAPEEVILGAVGLAFGSLPVRQTVVSFADLHQPTERFTEKKVDGSQSYIMLGGLGPSWHQPDMPAFEIAMAALGGSMYSRLPLILRDRDGEVYNIESSLESFVEAGAYYTYTDCHPDQANKVIKQIIDSYQDVFQNKITQEELDLARSVLVGGTVIFLDELTSRAEFFGSHLLLHNIFMSPEERSNLWKKVSLTQLEQSLKKYLTPRSMSLAVLGPTESLAQELLPR